MRKPTNLEGERHLGEGERDRLFGEEKFFFFSFFPLRRTTKTEVLAHNKKKW